MKKLFIIFLILFGFSCNITPNPEFEINSPVYYKMTQYDFDGKTEVFPIIVVQYNDKISLTNNNARIACEGITIPSEICDQYPEFCAEADYTELSECQIGAKWCEDFPEACSEMCNVGNDYFCTALPIELIYFYGTKIDNKILVKFATATEINADYVNLSASLDAETWYDVVDMPSECPYGCEYEYEDDLSWVIQLFK